MPPPFLPIYGIATSTPKYLREKGYGGAVHDKKLLIQPFYRAAVRQQGRIMGIQSVIDILKELWATTRVCIGQSTTTHHVA